MSRKPRKGAAVIVRFDRGVSRDDAKARLAERDQRQAADNRTPAEKWLNDPPQNRSALANRGSPGKS
jgi:hypothetical protein